MICAFTDVFTTFCHLCNILVNKRHFLVFDELLVGKLDFEVFDGNLVNKSVFRGFLGISMNTLDFAEFNLDPPQLH